MQGQIMVLTALLKAVQLVLHQTPMGILPEPYEGDLNEASERIDQVLVYLERTRHIVITPGGVGVVQE